MKVEILEMENHRFAVAIDSGTDLRAYFINPSRQHAENQKSWLLDDSQHFDQSIDRLVNLSALPVLVKVSESPPLYRIAS